MHSENSLLRSSRTVLGDDVRDELVSVVCIYIRVVHVLLSSATYLVTRLFPIMRTIVWLWYCIITSRNNHLEYCCS